MSRPAASRKDDEDDRPSKFAATTNDKGELLKAIVQKQSQMAELSDDLTQLIAQFLSMSPSITYRPDGTHVNPPDITSFSATSTDLHEAMKEVKTGMQPEQVQVRLDNRVTMCRRVLAWLDRIVKADRGRWMGDLDKSTIDAQGVLHNYALGSGVEIPVFPAKEDRRAASNAAWKERFGENTKMDEFLAEYARLGVSRNGLLIFDKPTTLLDIVEQMLTETKGLTQMVTIPFTLAALHIYGGSQFWVAILWNLIVGRVPGFWVSHGFWAAQLIEKGDSPRGRVTRQQLDRLSEEIKRHPHRWPKEIRSDMAGFGDDALWPFKMYLER